MLKMPLAVTDTFKTSYSRYEAFPFDKHDFAYSFELCDFEVNG